MMISPIFLLWPFVKPVLLQCHAAIRKDPSPKAKAESKVTKKRWNAAKIGLAARKAKVEKTKAEFLAQIEEQKE